MLLTRNKRAVDTHPNSVPENAPNVQAEFIPNQQAAIGGHSHSVRPVQMRRRGKRRHQATVVLVPHENAIFMQVTNEQTTASVHGEAERRQAIVRSKLAQQRTASVVDLTRK